MSTEEASKTTIECTLCAAKNLSLLKEKKITSICLGCLCLLGLGTATLSAYFFYKYGKIKRKMVELEAKIEQIENQFDSESDTTLDGQNGQRTGSPRPFLSVISSSSSSDVFDLVKQKKPAQPRAILKKSVSFGSDLDSYYETPLSSPTNFKPRLDHDDDDEFKRDLFAEIDDNQTLENVLYQSYESLKDLVEKKRDSYENVLRY
jgi:hypothetical protein